jgi:Glycosyltransferases involved in cell wall biogenesis
VNNKKHPLVSVIICNYNYGQYIGEAIESVMSQTYSNIELVIIDDGSTDNSRKVINLYTTSNPAIKYRKQQNQGIVFARNLGIELASGDYIVFLDSDDKFPNNYIKTLFDVAISRSFDITYCDLRQFGTGINRKIKLPEFSLSDIKWHNIVHISALIKRSIIKNHRFDVNLNKKLNHEDWDFFLALALDGARIGKTEKTYLLYRAHDKSRSFNSKDTDIEKALKSSQYIIEKYASKNNYSTDMQYLKCIGNYMKQVEECRNVVAYNEAKIIDLEKQLDVTKKSRSYRLGNVLTSPMRFFKKKN